MEHDTNETYEFSRTLLSQLSAVRDSGAVNMMSASGVQNVAEQLGFAELAEYLSSDRSYYRAPASYPSALDAMVAFDKGELGGDR